MDLSSSLAVPSPDPGLSEEHSELSEELGKDFGPVLVAKMSLAIL